MLFESLLLAAYSVVGTPFQASVPVISNYATEFDVTSGYVTNSVRNPNSGGITHFYDASVSFDIYYLTSSDDFAQAPVSPANCIYYLSSVTFNICHYSDLSDYIETYQRSYPVGITFGGNYGGRPINALYSSYVYYSFSDDSVEFDFRYVVDESTSFGGSISSGFAYRYWFTEHKLTFDADSMYRAVNNSYGAGYSDVYMQGFTAGRNSVENEDENIAAIFNGIANVGLLPLNMFLGMFNFNVLGINMADFVMALVTIALIVIVIKSVLGGKSK